MTPAFAGCRCSSRHRRTNARRRASLRSTLSTRRTWRCFAVCSNGSGGFVADLPDPASLGAKHLSFKPPDAGAVLPRVQRQTGLVACLCEEGLAVPLPFDSDLRQQQATMPTPFDDEAIAPDDDL